MLINVLFVFFLYLQTFNFAENGRHLANHNYRVCIRQELGMCSVAYEPCNKKSFRIGSGFTQFSSAIVSNVFADNNQTNEEIVQTSTIASSSLIHTEELDSGITTQLPDEFEGSGNDDESNFSILDIFPTGFFGNNRKARQFITTCTDRITMPCVVEDFIAAGIGNVPDCIPIHCGDTLCANGQIPCRIESTVKPFGIGVHFGPGVIKDPEDNIGACLRYTQMICA